MEIDVDALRKAIEAYNIHIGYYPVVMNCNTECMRVAIETYLDHANKHSDNILPGDCTPEEIKAHERRVKQIIKNSYSTKTPEDL